MKIGHMEIVTAIATQPNTGAAAAATTGDSLVVKSGRGPKILSAWATNQVAGFAQIVSPSGHDTTRGFRSRVVASQCDPLLPLGVALDVEPQETLAVTIAGSNVAGDIEQVTLLMGYEELPGSDQQKITWGQLQSRMDKLVTIDCTITAVAGVYADELINAESDLLQANRQYALLGLKPGVECGNVYLRGPDTANMRIGAPGNELDGELMSGYFATLARAFDAALIPVINSANKASTFIGCHQDENATAVTVSAILALLK